MSTCTKVDLIAAVNLGYMKDVKYIDAPSSVLGAG